RTHARRAPGHAPLLAELHRLQLDLLSHALPGPDGYAPPGLYVSGPARLGDVEPGGDGGRAGADPGHAGVWLECDQEPAAGTDCRAESVGCVDNGVGHDVACASGKL